MASSYRKLGAKGIDPAFQRRRRCQLVRVVEDLGRGLGCTVGRPGHRQMYKDLRLARGKPRRAIERANRVAGAALLIEQPAPAVEDRRVPGLEVARPRQVALGVGEALLAIRE